jgi:hypothetical protein
MPLPLDSPTPPDGLSPALLALWHDGRGDWERAHEIAQDIDDETGSWVHAYLHRKEGDIGNAHYWYRRAGVTPAKGSLEEEWRAIVEALLARQG